MTNADRRPNVSRREASDVDRYRRMRQERENANPVRRAGHEVGRRLEGTDGVGGGLRESGEYRRQGFSPARGGRKDVGAYAAQSRQSRRAPRPPRAFPAGFYASYPCKMPYLRLLFLIAAPAAPDSPASPYGSAPAFRRTFPPRGTRRAGIRAPRP